MKIAFTEVQIILGRFKGLYYLLEPRYHSGCCFFFMQFKFGVCKLEKKSPFLCEVLEKFLLTMNKQASKQAGKEREKVNI